MLMIFDGVEVTIFEGVEIPVTGVVATAPELQAGLLFCIMTQLLGPWLDEQQLPPLPLLGLNMAVPDGDLLPA